MTGKTYVPIPSLSDTADTWIKYTRTLGDKPAPKPAPERKGDDRKRGQR